MERIKPVKKEFFIKYSDNKPVRGVRGQAHLIVRIPKFLREDRISNSEILMAEIRERLRQKPEDYLKKLFLYPKEIIVDPDAAWNLEDLKKTTKLENLQSGLDEIEQKMSEMLNYIECKRFTTVEGDHAYALSACDIEKIRQMFDYITNLIREIKKEVNWTSDEILKIHAEIIGRLLALLTCMHNVVAEDLTSGINPEGDEKVRDCVDAINLITLQYGILMLLSENGVVDHMFFEDRDLGRQVSMLGVMPTLAWKSRREILEKDGEGR